MKWCGGRTWGGGGCVVCAVGENIGEFVAEFVDVLGGIGSVDGFGGCSVSLAVSSFIANGWEVTFARVGVDMEEAGGGVEGVSGANGVDDREEIWASCSVEGDLGARECELFSDCFDTGVAVGIEGDGNCKGDRADGAVYCSEFRKVVVGGGDGPC